MSLNELKDLVMVINLIVSIGGVVYAYLTRAGREAVSKVDALLVDHGALAARVARVEGELETVPSKDELHKLQLEMVTVRGSIDVLNERLKPVAFMVARLQEHMLEERK